MASTAGVAACSSSGISRPVSRSTSARHGSKILDGAVGDEQARQDRVGLERRVAERACAVERLVEQPLRLGELADLHRRLTEVGEHLEPLARALRQQLDRASQQVDRRPHVAAAEGAPARGAEVGGGTQAQGDAVGVVRGKLEQVAARLLEVVADDLLELELAVAVAVDPLGPAREARMQPGAGALRQTVVGGVADHDVVEAEGVGGVVAAHELARLDARELVAEVVTRLGDELRDGLHAEDESDDRGRLDDHQLVVG